MLCFVAAIAGDEDYDDAVATGAGAVAATDCVVVDANYVIDDMNVAGGASCCCFYCCNRRSWCLLIAVVDNEDVGASATSFLGVDDVAVVVALVVDAATYVVDDEDDDVGDGVGVTTDGVVVDVDDVVDDVAATGVAGDGATLVVTAAIVATAGSAAYMCVRYDTKCNY